MMSLMVRVRKGMPETAVVLMSAYTPAELEARGLGVTAAALLTKPFDKERLQQCIREPLIRTRQ